ncbi:MAG: hypothetical protein ACI85O_002936, partial [Saprospiraceae bacterium]
FCTKKSRKIWTNITFLSAFLLKTMTILSKKYLSKKVTFF